MTNLFDIPANRAGELIETLLRVENLRIERIGNSQIVAREHYLRVTEEDFTNASSEEWLAKWLATGAEKSEQNGHSPGAAQNSLLLQIVQKVLEEQGLEQFGATVGKALQNYQAPPVGLERTLGALHLHGVSKAFAL